MSTFHAKLNAIVNENGGKSELAEWRQRNEKNRGANSRGVIGQCARRRRLVDGRLRRSA